MPLPHLATGREEQAAGGQGGFTIVPVVGYFLFQQEMARGQEDGGVELGLVPADQEVEHTKLMPRVQGDADDAVIGHLALGRQLRLHRATGLAKDTMEEQEKNEGRPQHHTMKYKMQGKGQGR